MPILGIIASGISGHLFNPTGNYESIATVSVGSGGQASISFTSIPSTYTHLQIRGIQRGAASTGTSNIRIQLNGSYGAYTHWLYGNGSAAYGDNGAASYLYTPGVSNTTAANVFSVSVTDILDYANTNKYKTVRTLAGYDANGSGRISLFSNLFQTTSAVTSITIDNQDGNVGQYTHFALYGIK